jgi:hypothetical protein
MGILSITPFPIVVGGDYVANAVLLSAGLDGQQLINGLGYPQIVPGYTPGDPVGVSGGLLSPRSLCPLYPPAYLVSNYASPPGVPLLPRQACFDLCYLAVTPVPSSGGIAAGAQNWLFNFNRIKTVLSLMALDIRLAWYYAYNIGLGPPEKCTGTFSIWSVTNLSLFSINATGVISPLGQVKPLVTSPAFDFTVRGSSAGSGALLPLSVRVDLTSNAIAVS